MALLVAGPCWAGDSYTAKTLGFDYDEAGGGPVPVVWSGEVGNESAKATTLCAVLQFVDAKGAVLHEVETAAINVARFGAERHRYEFRVPREIWEKADSLRETARPSRQQPVNGKLIRQVEIYTTSWCPYCQRAKGYLVSHGIDFTEYDVEADPSAARERDRLNPEGGVPTAVIDGEVVVGFSVKAYDRVFAGE